ncbi:hypothetical protein Tco_1547632 [Tanacetum coccineum]
MNEGAGDPDKKKKFVKEDVSAKVPAKQDAAEQGTKKRKCGHMKMIARKRKRPQPDVDNNDEHRKCLKIVTFEGTIDSEIMERKSVIARLNKQYSEVTLEGIELILWGRFEDNDGILNRRKCMQVTFWNNQQNWENNSHMEIDRKLDVTSSSVGSHMAHSRSPGSRVLTFGDSLFLVRCGYDNDFSLILIQECGMVACLEQPFVLFRLMWWHEDELEVRFLEVRF